MVNIMKDYYEGFEYKMLWNDSPDTSVWRDVWVPVVILKKYPKWMLVEVQPHKNPNGMGISKPYRIGINQMALKFGEIRLMEKGTGRWW